MTTITIHASRIVCSLLVIFTCMTVKAATADNDAAAKAMQLKQKAISIYAQQPDSAILLLDQAARLFAVANDTREVAICKQQTAYIYDEYRKDAYKAVVPAKEALALWKEVRDTPASANMHRYIAYLQSKIYDVATAKKNIDTAVQLYSSVGDKDGAASAYMVLSSLYELEKKPDSATGSVMLAQQLWKQGAKPELHTFSSNNTLLRIYVLNNMLKEAGKTLKENARHVNDGTTAPSERTIFYYYGWIYYQKTAKKKNAAKYKARYDMLKNKPQT